MVSKEEANKIDRAFFTVYITAHMVLLAVFVAYWLIFEEGLRCTIK